ncbi:MAG: DNA helicase II [Pseudomonadota bacterium]
MKTTTNPLNPAQQKAVTAEENDILVLAGAGSGKTRVLTHRISWLIHEKNISPFAILAVTFTNKAANEMSERISALLNMPIHGMWIGTFHSLAHRLLRLHWQAAKLPESFQILDSDDQHQLIKRTMRQLELDEEKWPVRQVQWFINKQKDAGTRPRLSPSDNPFDKTMQRIYQAYEERCQQGGLVDFAELLLRAHELWQQNPHILQHYRQRFAHVLIDEFQDTNAIQYAWIHSLSNPNTHTMVVGDDDQSIYSWRGARVENLHRFQKDFSNVQIIKLEQNYRSTSNILNAANAVIAQNNDRLGKTLWTETGDGELISLYQAYNDYDEAHFIVQTIHGLVRQGSVYKDYAVLYRSNAQSRLLEEKLLQFNVPYRVYGGQRFFERAEIKDALAYLHLMNNHGNDAAFERAVHTPSKGIGEMTMASLRTTAHDNQCSLWIAAKQLIQNNLLSGRAHNALSNFIELIEQLTTETATMEIEDITEHMLHRSGLFEHYKKIKTEKGQAKLENLEELINAVSQFESDPDETLPPLAGFLARTALDTGETQADQSTDHVQLMTLHSAKGLEFPVVFLAGLEEGLFPHQMSINERDGLEEERRLCYVGMTRAQRKLYLTYSDTRRLHGHENLQRPSRFLREIPEKFFSPSSRKVNIRKPMSYPFQSKRKSDISPEPRKPGELYLGQNVSHKKFGPGVITHIEGSGPAARIQIKFNRVGSKWLVAEFASLETI